MAFRYPASPRPYICLVLNGPNINFLGIREKSVYGAQDYQYLLDMIRKKGEALQQLPVLRPHRGAAPHGKDGLVPPAHRPVQGFGRIRKRRSTVGAECRRRRMKRKNLVLNALPPFSSTKAMNRVLAGLKTRS